MRLISTLILLTLSLYSLEEEDTSYSMILKNVRTDIVRKAYLKLPKRTSTNILILNNLMKQEIENYSLNYYEIVYFVYYWITQNIEIDCSNKENQFISIVRAYNEGKSSYVGISLLFSTMVNNLGLQSNTIEGTVKMITDNTYSGEIVEIIDHIWNYVIIDNNYYLFDPTYGSGTCEGRSFWKQFNNFYFGTNPEYFIRSHLPENDKWQLLETKVSKEKFASWPYVSIYFYLNGFSTISPDTYTIKISSNLQITLSYDKSRNLGKICKQAVFDGSFEYSSYQNCEISNGVFKSYFAGNEKMDYFIMYAGPKEESKYKSILIYKVN